MEANGKMYYHIFPFEKISSGSEIIIWGFGEVGREYVQQLERTGYCRIKYIVDLNWANMTENERTVFPPEKISEETAPTVVIADADVNVAMKIKESIKNLCLKACIVYEDQICDIPKINKSENASQRTKIAIYGAGKCGDYIAQEIIEHTDSKVEIVLFIDNNPNLDGHFKYNVPIVNVSDFIESYRDTVERVIIASFNVLIAQEMVVSLLNKAYSNVYLIPESVKGQVPILNKEGEMASCIKHISLCKPVLSYIEYHVSDFCNLKCKGCCHFSNRVTEKVFPDINEFINTLDSLHQKFNNIVKFRLLGGEPFVNPDLGQFVYAVREYFPYSDIRVASNGLLLPNVSDKTLKAIREGGATIDITQYPPTRQMLEKIIETAEKHQIKINVGGLKTEFFKWINYEYVNNREINEKTYRECISKKCHFLSGEHLYFCMAVYFLKQNKDFLELNISEQMIKKHSFDLINGHEDGWEILQKLMTPYDFCGYCTERHQFDWIVSDKKIGREDWIVMANEK